MRVDELGSSESAKIYAYLNLKTDILKGVLPLRPSDWRFRAAGAGAFSSTQFEILHNRSIVRARYLIIWGCGMKGSFRHLASCCRLRRRLSAFPEDDWADSLAASDRKIRHWDPGLMHPSWPGSELYDMSFSKA